MTAQPAWRWFAGYRSERDALRLEVERLRVFVEMRAQAQENMARAMLADSAARAAEAVEGRIQLATQEAIAFAQAGLESHEAALRALGRRVAAFDSESAPALPLGSGAFWIGDGGGDDEGQAIPIPADSDESFLAALSNLPIAPGGATRLIAAHVIEFVPAAALATRILPHWRSRLAPSGELHVETLDGPAWLADFQQSAQSFGAAREKLGADGVRRPVRHLLDADELAHALKNAGFEIGAVVRAPPHTIKVTARLGD